MELERDVATHAQKLLAKATFDPKGFGPAPTMQVFVHHPFNAASSATYR